MRRLRCGATCTSTPSFRPRSTARRRVILDRLRALGLDDVRESADTGATAIVRGAKPGPNLLWRADIDGLPLIEETGLPFASNEKAMHACGHDGHVAIALAMAEALQQSRASLAGSVRFAFQPAEEHVGGARRMIAEGIMDAPKVDRAFGLHIWRRCRWARCAYARANLRRGDAPADHHPRPGRPRIGAAPDDRPDRRGGAGDRGAADGREPGRRSGGDRGVHDRAHRGRRARQHHPERGDDVRHDPHVRGRRC